MKYVEIVERKTGIVEERIPSDDAESIQKGININLNQIDYFTRIVEN